ncbi:hypothetical protein ACF0H5_000911 [Mactra antiquata]
MDHLQKQIDDLKRAVGNPRNKSEFVKDDDRRGNSPNINKYGVYNAYKWLMWKSRLMYLVWEIRSRPSKQSTNQSSKDKKHSDDSSKSGSNQPRVVTPDNDKSSVQNGKPASPREDLKPTPPTGPKRPGSNTSRKKSYTPNPD